MQLLATVLFCAGNGSANFDVRLQVKDVARQETDKN